MELASIILSILSLMIAISAVVVARLSWLQANRPIITVKITNHASGNVGTTLNILVENTGNRPAKNIRLRAAKSIIESFFAENSAVDKVWRDHIMRVFCKCSIIPILANGKSITNSFGILSNNSEDTTWKKPFRVEIEVEYEGLDGRKFRNWNPLNIASDDGFAGGSWKKRN